MKLRPFLFWQLWLMGALSLGACSYTRYKNQDSDFHRTPHLNKEETLSIGFSEIYQEVLEPYCLSCHRGGGWPMQSYQEVRSILSEIRESVFVTGRMPKDRALPQRERSLLLSWIDNGAPEKGRSQTVSPLPPPLEPTFSSIKTRIFQTRCGECHIPSSSYCENKPVSSGEDTDHGYRNKESCRIVLTDYQELLFGEEARNKEFVIPGNAEESQLLIALRGTEDRSPTMPPKEEGYEWLDPAEIKAIEDWINAGALNN